MSRMPKTGCVWGQKVTVSKQLKGVIKGAITFPLKLLPDIFLPAHGAVFPAVFFFFPPREDSDSNMFFFFFTRLNFAVH